MADNVQKILAIELLCATQALHLRKLKDPSFRVPEPLGIIFETCREISPPLVHDRYLKSEYLKLLEYMKSEMPVHSIIPLNGNNSNEGKVRL